MYVGWKSNTILGNIIFTTQISGSGAITSQKQETYDKNPEFKNMGENKIPVRLVRFVEISLIKDILINSMT